jgi:tetratricopeptide (TPR) repeat protein
MASPTVAILKKFDPLTLTQRPSRLPALPWRDPHSVPPEKLAEFIESLIQACLQNPENADLRTCLGIAYAMNYDPQHSMDALEEARRIEPENYFAQLKYAELLYRMRVIDRAETETLRALDLAGNNWEIAVARRQLSEIRQLRRKGMVRPDWTKSLKGSAIGFLLLLLGASWIYMVWK